MAGQKRTNAPNAAAAVRLAETLDEVVTFPEAMDDRQRVQTACCRSDNVGMRWIIPQQWHARSPVIFPQSRSMVRLTTM